MPDGIDWFLWRPCVQPKGAPLASMLELRQAYTLAELYEMHQILDMLDTLDTKAAAKVKVQ